MNYRKANYQDVSKIANLHAISWQNVYRGILADNFLDKKVFDERKLAWKKILGDPLNQRFVLLVESDDIICGFICALGGQHNKLGTLVENLHVNSEYKGQGFGTRLLAKAAEWSLHNYPDAGLYLEVLEENHNARGFYESLGAVNAGESIWLSPCNTEVKELLYAWAEPSRLLLNSSNKQ